MTISVPQIVPDDDSQRRNQDIRQRMLELRDRQIQYAVSQAARTSPQRARQATTFGLPTSVPDDIFQTVQSQQTTQRILDLSQQSPLTAAFFQNPEWASVALDIPEEPGVVEKTWNSLKAGAYDIWASAAGFESMGLEQLQRLLGPEYTPDFVKDLHQYYRSQYQSAALRSEELAVQTGDWSDWVYGGIRSLPLSLSTAVAAVATAPFSLPVAAQSAIGLSLAGASATGESYQRYRELGVEPNKALVSAISNGVFEAATEKLAFTRLLDDIELKSPLGKFFVNQITAEVPGEIVAGISQDYVDFITDPRRENETVGQWVSNLPEVAAASAVAAFTQGTVMSAGAKALTTVLGRQRNEQAKALTAAEKLQAINGAIEGSVLRQQAPDIYRQLNQQASEMTGVSLRVEAQRLTEAVNDSIGMAAFAQAAPEAARQLAELGNNPGTEIELSVAEYADLIGDAAKSEPHAQLRDSLGQHVIVNENEMSMHDQELASQQVPAFVAAMEAVEKAAAVTDDTVAAEASVIENRLLEAFGLEPSETEQELVIKPDVVLGQTEATEQAAEEVVSDAAQQEQPTEQPLQAAKAVAEQIPVDATQSVEQIAAAAQQIASEVTQPVAEPVVAPTVGQQFESWFMGSRAATSTGFPMRLQPRLLKGAAEGQMAYSVMEGNKGGSAVSIRNPVVLTGKQAQAFVANATYRAKVLERARKEGRDGVVAHTKKKGRKEAVFVPLKSDQVRDYQKLPDQPDVLFSRRLDSDQPGEPAATPEEAEAHRQYVEQGDTKAADQLESKVVNRVANHVFPAFHGLAEGMLKERRFMWSKLGSNTEAKSAEEGLFLSKGRDTAKSYASFPWTEQMMDVRVPQKFVIEQASELTTAGSRYVDYIVGAPAIIGQAIKSIYWQYDHIDNADVFDAYIKDRFDGQEISRPRSSYIFDLFPEQDIFQSVESRSGKIYVSKPNKLSDVIEKVYDQLEDETSQLSKNTTGNANKYTWTQRDLNAAPYGGWIAPLKEANLYLESVYSFIKIQAANSNDAQLKDLAQALFDTNIGSKQSGDTFYAAAYSVIKNIKIEQSKIFRSTMEIDKNIMPDEGVFDAWVFMNNPYFHDDKGSTYREESYYRIIKRAKDGNHDGVVIQNTYDGNDPNGPSDDVYVIFTPEQVKARGAVRETDKNGGGLIPLDKRFNLRKDDVYYSRDLEAASGTGTPPDQIRASARLASIMFANLAKTMEVSAEELWQRFGARIQSDPSLTEPGAYLPRDMLVLLSDKNATALDILHELTHHYMHVLSVVGSDAQSSEAVRKHWQSVLDTLGVKDAAAWNALSAEEKAKHHETLADWFTLYIAEDKAPSEGVRRVMAKMAAFFRGVYTDLISKINKRYRDAWGEDLPALTDDVRTVFDSMVASEATIRVAKAAAGATPMFQDFQSSNMTIEDWEEYQALQELLTERAINKLTSRSVQAAKWAGREMQGLVGRIQRELKKDRAEVRAVAEDKVRQDPVYQLLALLRQGKSWSDGKLQDAQQKVKLDADLVKASVEQDPDKPGYIDLSGLYGRNGLLGSRKKAAQFTGLLIDPKIVADAYGFDSVTAMMDALVNAQPIEERIDAEVSSLLADRNDLFDPDTGLPDPVKIRQMAEQEFASAGYADQLRQRIVGIELKALLQTTTPVRVMVQAARAAARQHLARQQIGRIDPKKHARSAARASKYVLEVLANGYDKMLARADRAVASAQKRLAKTGTAAAQEAVQRAEAEREQVVAAVPEEARGKPDNGQTSRLAASTKRNQLAHEALERESVEAQKQVTKGKKYLQRAIARSESWNKGLGANFADLIDNILASFSIGNRGNAARWSVQDVISAIQKTGVPIEEEDISTPLLERIQSQAGENGFDIDTLTLSEFQELIELIKMLEHLGREGQKMLRSKQKEDAEQAKVETVESVRDNGPKKKASQRSATTWWARSKDGLNKFLLGHTRLSQLAFIMDGGRMNGALWKLFVDPAQDREAWRQQAHKEYTDKLDAVLKPLLGRFRTNVGRIAGLSEERQKLGQRDTFTVEEVFVMLLNLGNQGNEVRLLRGENWNKQDVVNAISSVLTAEEIRAAQQIWNLFEELWPEIDRLERAVYGRSPVKEVHTPLVVRSSDGKDVPLSGGYIPISYDPQASGTQSDLEAQELAKGELGAINVSATTKRTFAKKRTDTGTGDPLHLQMSGVFRGFSDVIHDIAFREFLINTQRVFSRGGRVEQEIRRFYGQNTVREIREWITDIANANRKRKAFASGTADFIRKNQSISVLGASIASGLIQVTGLAMIPFRTGVKPFLYGVTRVMSSPSIWFDTMRQVGELDPAMATRYITYNRELADVAGRVQGKSQIQDWWLQKALLPIYLIQGFVDAVAWHAGRAKAIEDGIMDFEQQIKIARQTVFDTQGDQSLVSRARVERADGWVKLFTMFINYPITQLGMARGAMSKRDAHLLSRMGAVAGIYLLPIILETILKDIEKPDEEEKDVVEYYASKIANTALRAPLEAFVGIREISGVVDSLTDNRYARQYAGPAGLAAIGDIYRLVDATVKDQTQTQITQSINLLGRAFGIPSAQINRTLSAIRKAAEGQDLPPQAFIFGTEK